MSDDYDEFGEAEEWPSGEPTHEPPDPCPECAVGKHWNCDDRTWDFFLDTYALCPCAEAGHGQEG